MDSELAGMLGQSVNEHFYDANTGTYMAGTDYPVHSQDATVGAIAAGLTDPLAALSALDRDLSSPYGPLTVAHAVSSAYVESYISPFMSGYQLIELLEAGQAHAGLSLLLKLWGRMAVQDPGTFWEAMNTQGEPLALDHGALPPGQTSLAHGWSAAPAYALPAYVAGVRAIAPGWKEWVIEPLAFSMGLRYVSVKVPTPQGSIEATLKRMQGKYEAEVKAPSGTAGQIVLPCGKRKVQGSEAKGAVLTC